MLLSVGYSQTFSSHSGWSFQDTLESATDVIVGDILSGAGVDNGSRVTAKAAVRVVRVLQGGILPGADLALEWQYQPAPTESPAASAKVPLVRALWFLRKKADGGYEPLVAAPMSTPSGGYFVPLSRNALPGRLFYTPDTPAQTKIAKEVAAALEDLLTRNAADFGPHQPQPPANGVLAPWVQSRVQYQALTMVLNTLKPAAARDVFQYFSTQADANLKMLGLMGRLSDGDTSAVFELERDLPRLASTFDTGQLSPRLMGLDVRGNTAAAHSLGRMALADTTLPGLEAVFPRLAAQTRKVEFVPYLVAMLGSPPNSFTRGAALSAFCQLLEPLGGDRSKPQALWQPEMASYCPNGIPMNNPEQEQRDVTFWRQWWDAHREEIQKVAELPSVSPPARYNVAATVGPPQVIEIPMEVRFQSLLHMSSDQSSHYHTQSGALVEGPPPGGPYDPVSAKLDATDREAFRRLVDATNRKLEEEQKRDLDVMNAARLAGTVPDAEKAKAMWAERLALLKAGLAEMKNKLSPQGWQVVEQFLTDTRGGVGGMIAAPPK